MQRVVLVLAALAAPAGRATADPGFAIGAQPAWFVTAGVTTGGTLGPDRRGGFVGGELGLVRLREARVLGVYADAYRDFGLDATYLTLGPELAAIRRSRALPIALGVDGGAVVRRAGTTALGATGRVFVAVAGTFAVFARYAYVADDRDAHVIQLGVTMKLPLGPFGGSR